MRASLRFAACQFPVSGDAESNCRHILKHMRAASSAGADVAHFPEAALPGYIGRDIAGLADLEWPALQKHTETISAGFRPRSSKRNTFCARARLWTPPARQIVTACPELIAPANTRPIAMRPT